MEIRQAVPGDALLLSTLNVDVQRLHAENHPDIFKFPMSNDFAIDFFDEKLADSMTSIFIAEEKDGQALGYVVCQLTERADNPFTFPQHYILIDQISVSPKVQRRGVGSALIERVVKMAKESSVKKIQLGSWAFNTEAHTFFEKMGFEKFHHRFWRSI